MLQHHHHSDEIYIRSEWGGDESRGRCLFDRISCARDMAAASFDDQQKRGTQQQSSPCLPASIPSHPFCLGFIRAQSLRCIDPAIVTSAVKRGVALNEVRRARIRRARRLDIAAPRAALAGE